MDSLPTVRGAYRFDADLKSTNWFQVGGTADVLFKPADAEDLAVFMGTKQDDLPVMVIGVGSNIIVRDGGIRGVVVKLGRGFALMSVDGDRIHSGAGVLCVNLAEFAAQNGISGLEFMRGIPGTVGGALAMNAGAYGKETKDVLAEAELVTVGGEILKMDAGGLGYSYRSSKAPKGAIFTAAVFNGIAGDREEITARMNEIQKAREETQPIRSKTGGSTFKNPEGHKAWELIDKAGCRGLKMGGAKVSEKHCNFLINEGEATALDLENLGEEVRRRVKEACGIELEWEIKRIGEYA